MKSEIAPHVAAQIRLQQNEVKRQQAKLKWLKTNRVKLSRLPPASFCGDYVDFDNLTHPDVIRVVKAFGGKWNKSIAGEEIARVDYTKPDGDLTIRCYHGEPPPNCKIIETVELVPAVEASTRVVKRLVCK